MALFTKRNSIIVPKLGRHFWMFPCTAINSISQNYKIQISFFRVEVMPVADCRGYFNQNYLSFLDERRQNLLLGYSTTAPVLYTVGV